MKEHESSSTGRMAIAGLVVICMLASCTGDADPIAAPMSTAVRATPAAEAVAAPSVDEVKPTAVIADPTPTVAPIVVSDDARIAAAYAAFDADPEPAELVEWDFGDPRVSGAGLVSFSVCGWDGQGVFDQVYDAVYETTAADDGSITTRRRDVAIGGGECLNTALIDSVFAFLREFNGYLGEMLEAPELFSTDSRSIEFWSPDAYDSVAQEFQMRQDRGTTSPYSVFKATDLPGSSVAEVLWRRFDEAGQLRFEIGVCQEMDGRFGEYLEGALVDDLKVGTISGPHSITQFSISREAGEAAAWRVHEALDAVWGDCLNGSDWRSGMDAFRPGPAPWIELVQ